MKKVNLIIIFCFILLISLPTVFGILLPINNNSDIENRRLTDLPKTITTWEDIKELPSNFDKYYADHFGFRWNLLIVYRFMKYFLKDSPSEKLLLGSDPKWIFYVSKKGGDPLGDFRNINQLNKHQLAWHINRILSKQKWLAKRGIEYLFVIAPSKLYIYPEKLPKYISRTTGKNIINQLTNELKLHPQINYIDLRPAFKKARNAKRLLFYKADTHWNFYGANIAQFEITKKIKELFPNQITPSLYSLNRFINKAGYIGDLGSYMGYGKDFVEDNFNPNVDKCSFKYFPEKTQHDDTFSTVCNESGLNAVIFRDSFFSILQLFMSPYFNKSTYIWKAATVEEFELEIKEDMPDIVIDEKIDRYY